MNETFFKLIECDFCRCSTGIYSTLTPLCATKLKLTPVKLKNKKATHTRDNESPAHSLPQDRHTNIPVVIGLDNIIFQFHSIQSLDIGFVHQLSTHNFIPFSPEERRAIVFTGAKVDSTRSAINTCKKHSLHTNRAITIKTYQAFKLLKILVP